ncbi:DUF1365 domain-containing protein [Neptunicella marina]|uniref:DUF1365 domain-containing protein n=1 Tax=Neptunicella marina TaxID=2125989 RepID=A0A8J6IRH4_9ALTE|nr:DUF1365 domain-containing protein [Neptunicella marina]
MPKKHNISMDMFMLYLDIDDIDQQCLNQRFLSLNKFNWLSVYRRDYFAPQNTSLKQAVIDKVRCDWPAKITLPEIKQVFVLTQPRFLGYVFNPLSLYYCFDANNQLCAVLAEVSNTPWNERHAYVIPCTEPSDKPNQSIQYEHDKAFHVSPFHPMNMCYQWRLTQPANNVQVSIENWHKSDHKKHFVATFSFDASPLSDGVGRYIWRFPLMTAKVVLGIYWHALRLWLKGLTFYSHPLKK